jgi:hypothetical protein
MKRRVLTSIPAIGTRCKKGDLMNSRRLGWAVVGIASVAIVTASGILASGGTIKIVSPSAQENVEGDGAVQPDIAPGKIQRLYPASDFAGLPASQRWLVAFNHRGDQTQSEAVDWVFPDTEIWISTTDKTSDTLSTVFAENHGPDKTLVYDGALTQSILGTGSPRDFADGMRFQTPFYYDPSQGNLLIERINRGGSLPDPSPTVDVQSTSGFTVLAGNVGAVSGTLFSRLPLTQFEFVPEPAGFVLGGTALLGLFVRRRNW